MSTYRKVAGGLVTVMALLGACSSDDGSHHSDADFSRASTTTSASASTTTSASTGSVPSSAPSLPADDNPPPAEIPDININEADYLEVIAAWAATCPEGAVAITPEEVVTSLNCQRHYSLGSLGPSVEPTPLVDELRTTIISRICDPEFVPPDRPQRILNWKSFFQTTAADNPEQGQRWLTEGVLSLFQREELDNGSVSVTLDFNQDVLDVLADGDESFLIALASNRDKICVS